MKVFKTQADDKSISIYYHGGLAFLLTPNAQITMQGAQALFTNQVVRELDLAMCVSPSSNGSKMRSLWTNQMKS